MQISKPLWVYKPINVPKLDQIKKEFQRIHEKFYSNLMSDWVEQKLMSHLFRIDHKYVKLFAPTYIEFLKELNLYDRWLEVAFSPTVGPYNNAKESIVHVDDYDWKVRSYALNMPVQNCHDSYTVFYKTKKSEGTRGIMPWYPDAPCFLDHELDGELARLSADQPAWVNVNTPHRPESAHELPRLIITTRFSPEIHEFFN